MTKQLHRTVRVSVAALDEILGVPFPVLNDGFVRVVDYMGSDESIVQAARVSYGAGTKKAQEDHALIRYLMRHRHTTPFEMCEIKLHIRAPMDCWRQWIRHRTANVNEYSTRYSVAIDSAQTTAETAWRAQALSNRQGSSGTLDPATGARLTAAEVEFQKTARALYEERLVAGVAREQARKDLPLSTYTEAYWKVDLHNLMHFLSLRLHAHAQHEIRLYSEVIGTQIVKRWCPTAWTAFEDYRLASLVFSRLETEMVRAIARGATEEVLAIARNKGWVDEAGHPQKRNREREEFEGKLKSLGFDVPWSEERE